MIPERPIFYLTPDNGKPEWEQVVDLFRRAGLSEPPARFRDELVIWLVWARYGANAVRLNLGDAL